jgi:hypothetical protein
MVIEGNPSIREEASSTVKAFTQVEIDGTIALPAQ